MLFNSFHYLLFLPIVAFLYFAMGPKPRKWLLLCASLYFYMVFSIPFVFLLISSVFINFLISRKIHDTRDRTRRRTLLAVGLFCNLGLLFFFKYYNFAAFSLATILGARERTWIIEAVVLPMGISFFTFQAISYLMDVYRREIAATDSLLDMALYITFFPQLVAGPIMRGKTFMPQFSETHHPNSTRIFSGVLLCLWGFIKKSFIADPIGAYVDKVYGDPLQLWSGMALNADHAQFSGLTLLMATYAFAIQIYCDFSGYTDIARGSARVFGFRLMVNFNAPYLAESFRDFWRKWHISLSTWLRDYLYIPLGGNRKGAFNTYRNMMITMLLGGLWHGANWTFVIWGVLHGIFLSLERFFGRANRREEGSNILFRALNVFLVFHMVCLAWIFFRSSTAPQAFAIIQGIVSWQDGERLSIYPLLILMLLFSAQLLKKKANFGELCLRHPIPSRWACYIIVVLLALLYAGSPPPEFIYFQF